MFRTTLQVAHVDQKYWRLTRPLVYEGDWEFIIIKSGFVTDFASIPKPVRWLLDNAGRNSEAAVLHDALWRESKRGKDSRIDPWHVDGLFRRALYQTGSISLSRSLMWFAVRAMATFSGRLGKLGPSFGVKFLQLAAVFILGLVTAALPTLIAIAGLLIYWIASWLAAGVWSVVYERRNDQPTNWPWPMGRAAELPAGSDDEALLVIISKAQSPDDTESDEWTVIDLAAIERLETALAGADEIGSAELEAALEG
ncbi:MAG: DUF1353 domain-containing protein [Acidimicrobiales bacterium]